MDLSGDPDALADWEPCGGTSGDCEANVTKLAAHPFTGGRSKQLDQVPELREHEDQGGSVLVRLFQEDQGHRGMSTGLLRHRYCGAHGRYLIIRRTSSGALRGRAATGWVSWR